METAYNPVEGTGWDRGQATRLWSASMERSRPAWNLRGRPGLWWWSFFNFGPWTGSVAIKDDGFHWRTFSYDSGEVIHHGVTTSIYAAYQSVIQNKPVAPLRHSDA